MQKPTSTFKLKKYYKRIIALSGGTAESRNQLKRMLIQAQLAEAFIPPQEKKQK